MSFKACRVFNENLTVQQRLVDMNDDELSPGEVLIDVEYSSLNYKDALACTGRGKIMRKFPLNAGIDLAGTVRQSSVPEWQAGDKVLANGCGLGEAHDGGLAQRARLPAAWCIAMPNGLNARQAMSLGTAGFTAALCLHRMEENGQTPAKGPIVVTGASGGVGSVAVALLSTVGYDVIALSGRAEHYDYLRELGAKTVCDVEALALGNKPLDAAKFGGVIDNVGGELLAKLIAHVDLWGNVASVGLAASEKLPTTVFPFILRGVSVLGVSSANCPMPLRRALWHKLGAQWKIPCADKIVQQEIDLSHVNRVCHDILDRKCFGRTLVRCEP